MLGVTQTDTFRVGRFGPKPATSLGKNGNQAVFDAAYASNPDLAYTAYYSDDMLCFDVVDNAFSRPGMLLYGAGNAGWVSNGTHLVGIGGEPLHFVNSNTESVVQIGELLQID